jgi:hypothetical protein
MEQENWRLYKSELGKYRNGGNGGPEASVGAKGVLERPAGHWWLMHVIIANQEAEIRRIAIRRQPGQIIHKTLSQKCPSQNRGW